MNGSLWDSLEKAFYSVYSTGITKAGFAKELLAYLASSEGGNRPAGVPDLDDNFASLIRLLADTLREAREQESDARRNQRLDRIINAFVADYPIGCTRDRASVTLRRLDAAADDSEAGDDIKAHTAKMRRKYKLASAPREKISDYQLFLEELRQIRLLPRLAFQGDPQRVATRAEKQGGSTERLSEHV